MPVGTVINTSWAQEAALIDCNKRIEELAVIYEGRE